MFDLGWSEILVIAVVGILVVGPKDLPRLMKGIGEWVAKARRMASHFQAGVDEMIRQAELEDLRKDLNTIRNDLRAPIVVDPRTTTTPPPDNLMVSLGETAFEVFHTPGHTPGHVVFFHPQARFAQVGDVLFQGSIGRTDFPKGDYNQLISSITGKLWPLGEDVSFVPGHGPMSTFGQERKTNPFVADQVLAGA